MAERIAQTMSHRAPQSPRRRKWSAAAALLICLLALSPLSALAAPAPGTNVASIAAAPNPGAFMTLDGAGADRDLGAGPSKDYMTVNLTLAQQAFVRVSFTGYAYAKSSAGGVITPGCPCLVRGELRANSEAKQIVTRTVVGTDGNDIAADPAATPAVAAADRRDFAGSHVFYVPAGSHTFTMSLAREVGTAQNVGFAFGRMQADILTTPGVTPPAPTPAPSPAPSVPGMPNTGGGAEAGQQVAVTLLGGLGLLGIAVVTLVAIRRRSI